MSRFLGYLSMKLAMRRHGDPITHALEGSNGDPGVAAFVEQLRGAASSHESIMSPPPIDAIVDAVMMGPDAGYHELAPARPSVRRRLVRVATAAGLTTKLLFGAGALAAVATTAAITGHLPNAVQDVVSDAVDHVGIEIPRGTDESVPPADLPDPTSPIPADRIEYRDAVRAYTSCVNAARVAYIAENGNAAGFDADAACGARPDTADYPAPGQSDDPPGLSGDAPGKPAETPGGPGDTPADTRPGNRP